MSDETDTEILEKRPLIKAIVDYCLKRLEAMIISLVVAGAIGGCNHFKESHDEKWLGDHLQQKQQEIEQLKENK